MKEQSAYKKKKGLFVIILALLWIPFIQGKINFYEEEPLKGDVQLVAPPVFDKEGWLSGDYQEKEETYLNQSFGFRNTMVRLNNQKQYTLYNKTNAKGVVIGKETYLYEENYITSYLGRNFVGEEKVTTNTDRLKKVQDHLKSIGKDIIFILAPGKASFFPEYIPDEYLKEPKTRNNYEAYLDAFKKKGINYLDFNLWFRENKGKKAFPLYSRCGIHWSKYSEILMADSIVKYIEKLRGVKLPRVVLDAVEEKEENLYEDYDIGNGMNLLFELPTYPMGYPVFHIEKNDKTKAVTALVVADSYYWGMFNYGISRDVFNGGSFWYYNKQIYPDSYNGAKEVSQIRIEDEIAKNDVFIMLFTDANLHNFDYGFTDLIYNSVFGLSKEQKNERVDFYINKIKNTPDWLENIKKQAKEQGKPLEQMIKENAEYMVFSEG